MCLKFCRYYEQFGILIVLFRDILHIFCPENLNILNYEKDFLVLFMIAICCLAMAMPAQAQLIKFGVKGGLNLSKTEFLQRGEGYFEK